MSPHCIHSLTSNTMVLGYLQKSIDLKFGPTHVQIRDLTSNYAIFLQQNDKLIVCDFETLDIPLNITSLLEWMEEQIYINEHDQHIQHTFAMDADEKCEVEIRRPTNKTCMYIDPSSPRQTPEEEAELLVNFDMLFACLKSNNPNKWYWWRNEEISIREEYSEFKDIDPAYKTIFTLKDLFIMNPSYAENRRFFYHDLTNTVHWAIGKNNSVIACTSSGAFSYVAKSLPEFLSRLEAEETSWYKST